MRLFNKIKIGSYRLELSVCIFLVMATGAAFWQLNNYNFLYLDDPVYVTKNHHVQAGLTGKSIMWALTTTDAEFWHPLTWLSHMMDCQLYGLRPGLHHLTNLLLHIANSVLLFLTLRTMTGAVWRSAFVAALFALHPLHVESVAWVAERKDVLSTFFWMLTIWSYAWYVKHPGINKYLLVLLFFILGLMAKPMLVTLPFVLLLLDYWPLSRFEFGQSGGSESGQGSLAFRMVLEKIPFFVLSAALSIVTFLAQESGGGISSLGAFPLNARIANALVSYVAYIGMMIWPDNLAVFYPHPGMLPGWKVLGAGLLMLAISFLAIRPHRQRPYFAVGWLWYIGTLIPVIGLVKFGAHAMADRFTYVPLIGIFIIIAWGAPELLAGWRYREIGLATVAVAVLSVLTANTWRQVGYWANSITLLEHALEVTESNWMAHNGLAVALSKGGRTAEAIIHYSEALRINPYFVEAHNNIGRALAGPGRTAEAIIHYSEALRLNPEYMKAHNNLGAVLIRKGKIEEAIDHFRKALDISPEYAEAHNNLGIALTKKGRAAEAISHFNEALRINPDYVQAHDNLGNALAKQGRTAGAISHFNEALRINPDYVEAHNNLGAVLFGKGKIKEAIFHFREALRKRPGYIKADKNLKKVLAVKGEFDAAFAKIQEELKHDPQNAGLYCRLGDLYNRTGDLDKAISQYQRALSIKPTFIRALNNQAVVYSIQMEYDKALSLFEKMTELWPDNAGTYYNIACLYARQNRIEESVEWIKKAIKRGYKDWNLIKTDKDLENIRGSSYYKEIVTLIESKLN